MTSKWEQVKARMKHDWKSQVLKKRYKVCDWTSTGFLLGALVVFRFVENSGNYVWMMLGVWVLLQVYCNRLMQQDKKLVVKKKK